MTAITETPTTSRACPFTPTETITLSVAGHTALCTLTEAATVHVALNDCGLALIEEPSLEHLPWLPDARHVPGGIFALIRSRVEAENLAGLILDTTLSRIRTGRWIWPSSKEIDRLPETIAGDPFPVWLSRFYLVADAGNRTIKQGNHVARHWTEKLNRELAALA